MRRLCDHTFSKSLKGLGNLTDHSLQKLTHTVHTEREREREICLTMRTMKSFVYGKDSDNDWWKTAGGVVNIAPV